MTELLAPNGLALLVVSLGRLGITYLWPLVINAKPVEDVDRNGG